MMWISGPGTCGGSIRNRSEFEFPRVELMRETGLIDPEGATISEPVLAGDLHIKGEVITNGDVELKGTVEGTISGNRVTLTSSAKVRGGAFCKALSVDEEACFDGRSQRVEDPLKDTKKRMEDEPAPDPQSRPAGESLSLPAG